MEHKLLVLCDPEEDYARHMAEFLSRSKELPWKIAVYTRPEELEQIKEEIDVLLISESAYERILPQKQVNLLVLLNESGLLKEEQIANINKYQSAELVKKAVLNLYIKQQKLSVPRIFQGQKTKLIGMYSPVRRCLQTTFAPTFGQLLAEQYRTLYLNFEYYGTYGEWEGDQRKDLSQLLYYLQAGEEDLFMYLQTVLRKIGNLDYVSSVVNGQDLLYVTVKEWQKLLSSIMEAGEYEYIILDLNENMQGLFEILRLCDRIYTILKDDPAARCKINQYEQLLLLQEYEDVKKKSSKCILPVFRKLPEQIEQYTKGELADYVRELLYQEGIE